MKNARVYCSGLLFSVVANSTPNFPLTCFHASLSLDGTRHSIWVMTNSRSTSPGHQQGESRFIWWRTGVDNREPDAARSLVINPSFLLLTPKYFQVVLCYAETLLGIRSGTSDTIFPPYSLFFPSLRSNLSSLSLHQFHLLHSLALTWGLSDISQCLVEGWFGKDDSVSDPSSDIDARKFGMTAILQGLDWIRRVIDDRKAIEVGEMILDRRWKLRSLRNPWEWSPLAWGVEERKRWLWWLEERSWEILP